jgi:hypothetical protein
MKCYKATVLIDDRQVNSRHDRKALVATLRAAIEEAAGPGSAVFDGLEAHVPEALLAVHEDRLPDQDKIRVELESEAKLNAMLLDAVGSTLVTTREALAQELAATQNELARVRVALRNLRAARGIPFYQYDRFRRAVGRFVLEMNAADEDRAAADERPGTDLVPHEPMVIPIMPKHDLLTNCAAGWDGDCTHEQCPQLADGEPVKSGRHCPLDVDEDILRRMTAAQRQHVRRHGTPPRTVHLGKLEMVLFEQAVSDVALLPPGTPGGSVRFHGMTVVEHPAVSTIITEV